MNNALGSTQRFSSRVENYIKYRPGYPAGIVELLKRECGLSPESCVADIGSGTGILTRLFLGYGFHVTGVEPNAEMRGAAERLLKGFHEFASVNGTAEGTTLESGSVDFIVAGQAFHWFDRTASRREFVRILKPRGWVVLVWNDRKIATTAFASEYEALLKEFSTDYGSVNHKNIDESIIRDFYSPGAYKLAVFPNQQVFDYEGLEGRLMSSSYAPEAGNPRHEPMLKELRELFDKHQRGRQVSFEYDTKVYYGQF